MDRSYEIKEHFQELISKDLVPENVMNLLLDVKGKVDFNLLKTIHKENMFEGKEFSHILFLIGCIVCGLDFIEMGEEAIVLDSFILN